MRKQEFSEGDIDLNLSTFSSKAKGSTYVDPIDFDASARIVDNLEVSGSVFVRDWSTSMDKRNQHGGHKDHCHQGMPKGTSSKVDSSHFLFLNFLEGIKQIES